MLVVYVAALAAANPDVEPTVARRLRMRVVAAWPIPIAKCLRAGPAVVTKLSWQFRFKLEPHAFALEVNGTPADASVGAASR